MASSLSSVAQLNMDLDSIIAQSKSSNPRSTRSVRRGGHTNHGGRPNRSSMSSSFTRPRTSNRSNPIASSSSANASSSFSRLHSLSSIAASSINSARIAVSNLDFGVTEADLWELFGRVGRVSKVQLNYDKNGHSQGTATITFYQHKDAIASVNQFHNVTLDGRAMKLELTVPPSKLEAPLIAKKPATPRRSTASGSMSNRSSTGLFRSSGPVSRGGVSKRGANTGGRRSGRGGGRRSRREPRKTISDLDMELDTFMSQRAAMSTTSSLPASDAMQTD